MPDVPFHLFASVLVISILHAILPNHWLPVVAISKRLEWSPGRTIWITFWAAIAHSLSTVIIGILAAFGGMQLESFVPFFKYLAAGVLIALGILFIWRHEHHHHFHLADIQWKDGKGTRYIIGSLLLAMFMSPCLEVGALFLVTGSQGWAITGVTALIYTITSAIGMTLFASLALHGLKKMNWHRIEHNSGLISGVVLILTGLLFFVWS